MLHRILLTKRSANEREALTYRIIHNGTGLQAT